MWKGDILRNKKKTSRWYEREFELQTDYKRSQYTYNKFYFKLMYRLIKYCRQEKVRKSPVARRPTLLEFLHNKVKPVAVIVKQVEKE